MSKVRLTLPIGEVAVTGKQVTFVAPCDCSVVDCLCIDGEDYIVVDALGNKVTGNPTGGVWGAGAGVSVLLNAETKKAFILNGNTPPITTARIREICK